MTRAVARATITQFFSDLSGELITDPSTTVAFVIDGSVYEVDLTTREQQDLRKLIAPYLEAGRRNQPPRLGQWKQPAHDDSSKRIRLWAREQGIALGSRGRIPHGVRAAFEAAQREDAAEVDDVLTA